ncbi:MAG TPA: phage major capsid protein [Clostridia bacterium]|nr:phage major capsid protein [Clostridia bacterium]
MTILELRDKRAKAWAAAKAFLNDHGKNGVLSAEDAAAYAKLEKDIDDMGEIQRLERAEALDKALDKPVDNRVPAEVPGGAPGKGADKGPRASEEYVRVFDSYLRGRVSTFEVSNILQTAPDAAGGYLCPDEYERRLIDVLSEENIMRRLGYILPTDSGERAVPVVADHGDAAWLGEGEEINDDDDAFTVVTLGAHKVATSMRVSVELLNDSVFNLDTYIANEFGRRIGAAEESAFLSTGTGAANHQPRALITDASAGLTAASATAITADELLDLVYSLRAPYRRKASFILHNSTAKLMRKLKDNTGNYLWQPSLTAGQPDMLLGYGLHVSPYMPEATAGKVPVVFGDYSYYWIADRQGRRFQRLNELYAKNGQVGFLAWQRVDGKLILPEAVKKLTMKAS